MFNKKEIRKFLFRWLVATVVFFLVKITSGNDKESWSSFSNPTSQFYYWTSFFFFMVTWEFNDWLIHKQRGGRALNFKSSLKIYFTTLVFFLPFSALVYYLALFPFKETLGIKCDEPVVVEFTNDVLRAGVICSAVVFINLFYFSMKQKEEMEKQMENLKKEIITSKYSSLRSQISPHFLFNSLNTLTSLMYEDRDLASDFVARLATSYRYILDNKEEDLVSLKKELNFLDAYVFMMEVRHKNAISIKMDIKIAAEQYWIPTLTLQMLIENALKHNWYSKEKPLQISIASIENSALTVKNSLRIREKEEETTNLGLENIKKRYSYYTNKEVLVREDHDYFEVIIPILNGKVTEMNLKTIS